MENLFIYQEYEDVSTDDEIRVSQLAIVQYGVFLFKDKNINNTDTITVEWNGQTDKAPSSATVYLQVYNRTTQEWITIDSDNSSEVNTDFTLEGSITTDLEDYYDENYWVAWRIYQ